jgi:hypothetical protein
MGVFKEKRCKTKIEELRPQNKIEMNYNYESSLYIHTKMLVKNIKKQEEFIKIKRKLENIIIEDLII